MGIPPSQKQQRTHEKTKGNRKTAAPKKMFCITILIHPFAFPIATCFITKNKMVFVRFVPCVFVMNITFTAIKYQPFSFYMIHTSLVSLFHPC